MTTKYSAQDTIKFLDKLAGTKLTLGKLINSIRLGDELSQVEFANKIGISRQQLCDIEHNRKTISPKLAAKYATILGYSSSQFIRLALQGIVDKDHLNVVVEIKPTKSTLSR
jgi:transcriptional regulator with XRE-family HTH domain